MHSQTFQTTKSIKESITKRYSSNQLISVLDDLIYKAIYSIILHTNFLDELFGVLLCWYSGAHRRKISSLSKDVVLFLLFRFLYESEVDRKFHILKSARLERNILFYFISLFLETGKQYRPLSVKCVQVKLTKRFSMRWKMSLIEDTLFCHGNLFAAYNQVDFWYKESIEFKHQIMEKYMRHAVMQANRYHKMNKRSDLDDIIQNYLLAVSKAIDKFDSKKGTLTSYINQWLLNAQSYSDSGHEYGIAYSIPVSIKKIKALSKKNNTVNISASLQDESVKKEVEIVSSGFTPEEEVEQKSEVSRIRLLAKYADPKGLGRIKLGIEEVLSAKEMKKLIKASVQENNNG